MELEDYKSYSGSLTATTHVIDEEISRSGSSIYLGSLGIDGSQVGKIGPLRWWYLYPVVLAVL
jgi:hypothetical protein